MVTMLHGSDHEGDGGWPYKDQFTRAFEDNYLKKGRGFAIVASEDQQVIQER